MAIKETIPFSFDELYTAVEQKFGDAGYDNQEGSTTMQLVTAMSYLTSMLNANTAVNVNETILSLARKRNNVLQDARVLGYEIAHTVSYTYDLTLSIPAGNFILPKYSVFTAGEKTYYYMGDQIELTDVSDGYELVIRVKEGTLKTYTDEDTLNIIVTELFENGSTIPQYYVDVPFTNIEENGIELFMTYYDEFGTLYQREEWTKSPQFMVDKDTVLNKQYVRLDDIDYKTPRLYFKLGSVGQDLRIGTIVELNVLQSSGTQGEMVELPNTTLECTVLNYDLILQGTDEESIDSIKYNAPLFHNSANRAVTKSDYIAICNRHETVDFSHVWDGDDEYPKKPGNIWFSFKPSTLIRSFTSDVFNKTYNLDNPNDKVNWYLEDSEVEDVWNVLSDYKIPTLIYNNRHPIYFDFNYDVSVVRYNIKTSEADINADIFNVINDYFKGTNEDVSVETFNFEYFQSNINKRIDKYLTDITGFNIDLSTNVTLLNKHIVNENNKKEVYFHLAVPFENYFDNDGNLITSVLPDITTDNFLNGETLSLDLSSLTGNEKIEDLIYINIIINNKKIGDYIIFNGTQKYILVRLDINDTDDTNSILTSDFDNLVMNVKYPSPNISFIRNTLPRLKTVNFI